MIRFLAPLIPGSVCRSLQRQVALLLIMAFGHIGQVAEVAAVGRIFLPLNTSEGALEMGIFTAFGAVAVQVLHVIQGMTTHSKAVEATAVTP